MMGFQSIKNKGFTLIEVVVALAILTWVLGSAIYLVKQYADERIRMRESFLGNQVAWNRLMDQYRATQGWMPVNEMFLFQTNGEEEQSDQSWKWELEVTEASGEGLYRYKVNTGFPETDLETDSVSSLSVFLVNQEAE